MPVGGNLMIDRGEIEQALYNDEGLIMKNLLKKRE